LCPLFPLETDLHGDLIGVNVRSFEFPRTRSLLRADPGSEDLLDLVLRSSRLGLEMKTGGIRGRFSTDETSFLPQGLVAHLCTCA